MLNSWGRLTIIHRSASILVFIVAEAALISFCIVVTSSLLTFWGRKELRIIWWNSWWNKSRHPFSTNAVYICSEYNDALRRLGTMSRGIGDPLVVVYSRCYLCRVSTECSSRRIEWDRKFLKLARKAVVSVKKCYTWNFLLLLCDRLEWKLRREYEITWCLALMISCRHTHRCAFSFFFLFYLLTDC